MLSSHFIVTITSARWVYFFDPWLDPIFIHEDDDTLITSFSSEDFSWIIRCTFLTHSSHKSFAGPFMGLIWALIEVYILTARKGGNWDYFECNRLLMQSEHFLNAVFEFSHRWLLHSVHKSVAGPFIGVSWLRKVEWFRVLCVETISATKAFSAECKK